MNDYDNRRPPQAYSPYGYTMPPTPQELYLQKRPLRNWANRICLGLLLIHGFMFGIVMLLSGLFFGPLLYNEATTSLAEQSIQLVSHAASFWIPTILVMSWIHIPASVAFPMRRPKGSIVIPAVMLSLGATVLGSLGSSFIATFVEQTTGYIPIAPDMSMPTGIAPNIVYVISMIVSPAIFEELMFRGVVLQSLRRFGDGFALAVSSILFGLIHGNLIQGPNAIFLGVVIGYFVLRTGSILTGMIIHAVINGLVVVSSYAMDYIRPDMLESFNIAIFAGYALLGCVGLAILLIRSPGIFKLAPSTYPLPTAKRYITFFTAVAPIIFLIVTVLLTCMYLE